VASVWTKQPESMVAGLRSYFGPRYRGADCLIVALIAPALLMGVKRKRNADPLNYRSKARCVNALHKTYQPGFHYPWRMPTPWSTE
jgi:hypothetical protein